VTPKQQKDGIWITYPVPQTVPKISLPQQPPTILLEQKICNLLPAYGPELWSKLSHNEEPTTPDLAEYIMNAAGPLLLVSDASQNAQQRSAFSWTISTPTSELWTGAGTSPGTQCDAHSGRAEGYGLLAAFTFLENYLQVTNPCFPSTPPIILGYCDNSGLIQQVTTLQANQILNPASTITNDYDLANKIHQTIWHILMPVKLQHVKGHQDQNTLVKDLPYEAQLNIACDKRARDNLKTLPTNT